MFTGHESASEEIKAPTYVTKLFEDFASLYLSENLSDVIFLVGGEKLHAHKNILAVRCKHFATLLAANPDKKEIRILDTSPMAFKVLLKYIYTDTITIPSGIELMLQVLILARRYSSKNLTSSIVNNLNILDAENVIFFVNGANNHDVDELRDTCHLFMDHNALQILSSKSFNGLTQKSIIQILKRNTFLAPEIEIFKSLAQWCKINNNNIVLECVRLSVLSVSEIVTVVWPTKLVAPEKLLQAISEIVASKNLLPRAILCMDENVATSEHGAKITADVNTTGLLTGNTDVNKSVKHMINGEDGIIICLSRPYCINHIRMMLDDSDNRYYSYYIERSLDRKKWYRMVDYSGYACRSVQNLYFEQQVAQYIKIVGTGTSKENEFNLVFFEAFYKRDIPKTINGVIRPEKNVATPGHKAIVLGGQNPHLLSGKYTYHRVVAGKPGSLIVQLAQPYLISSMQLLLAGTFNCKYFIETSTNETNWEIIVDRRNEECQSWQNLKFSERVVVFIKITGTYSTGNATAGASAEANARPRGLFGTANTSASGMFSTATFGASSTFATDNASGMYGNVSEQNFICGHFECPSEGEK